MSVTVEVRGLKELRAALLKLPVKMQGAAIYSALNAGAQPIKKDAQARVPVRTGVVKRAIRVSRSKVNKGKDGLTEVMVNVKKLGRKEVRAFKAAGGKSGANPNDPYYWRFLEFGTSKMPAKPFLRPAFESNKGRSLEAIRKKLGQAIEHQARKLNRA